MFYFSKGSVVSIAFDCDRHIDCVGLATDDHFVLQLDRLLLTMMFAASLPAKTVANVISTMLHRGLGLNLGRTWVVDGIAEVSLLRV